MEILTFCSLSFMTWITAIQSNTTLIIRKRPRKNALRKTDFQENLKIALIIYHLKKAAQLKIITNPNKKFELSMELMSIQYNVLIFCTGTIKTIMLLLVFLTTNIREIACLML